MTDTALSVNHQTPLSQETTRSAERFLTPAVDIFESDDALTLVADMPGVGKDQLEIQVDNGILTIEGRTAGPDQGEQRFAEFALAGYYRQFRLPDSLDAGQADAAMKDGVLTLRLPKAEAAKPRRIAVKTVH